MDTLDAGGSEGGIGFSDGVGQIDGAGGVLDDDAFEAKGGAVYRRVADAEVIGEAAEEELLEAAFAEVSGKPG